MHLSAASHEVTHERATYTFAIDAVTIPATRGNEELDYFRPLIPLRLLGNVIYGLFIRLLFLPSLEGKKIEKRGTTSRAAEICNPVPNETARKFRGAVKSAAYVTRKKVCYAS